MTEELTALETAFDGIIAGRGELSSFHADIARLIAQLMIASKSMADAGELTALASDVAKLEALLPPISAADAGEMDLRRLTDDELRELQRIQNKACNLDAPLWTPELPVEREMGEAERIGRNVGAWIDQRKEGWRFGGCSALEALHLRNELGSLCFPLIARNLWASIYRADMETEIQNAVRKALAAVGRNDVKLIPSAPEEPKRIDFHDHPLAPLKNRDGT